METRKSYAEYCKDFIKDNIENIIGTDQYGCDLGSELTMGINVDGTATYSRTEAKEYIREWWDDCANFSEWEQFNFGTRSNPFENSEVFHCKMVIEGVNRLLGNCSVVESNWDDNHTWTAEDVQYILAEIEGINEINL